MHFLQHLSDVVHVIVFEALNEIGCRLFCECGTFRKVFKIELITFSHFMYFLSIS